MRTTGHDHTATNKSGLAQTVRGNAKECHSTQIGMGRVSLGLRPKIVLTTRKRKITTSLAYEPGHFRVLERNAHMRCLNPSAYSVSARPVQTQSIRNIASESMKFSYAIAQHEDS